jgi:photosystem II stability/assembly factor-like uncharacterized protein
MQKHTLALKRCASGWMAASALLLGVPAQAAPDPLERPARATPRAANSVLLGLTRAGTRLVAVGERGVILLSDDDGKSWRQAKVPVSVALTNVHFATAMKGWASGHSGIVLHSSDGGETWSRQLDGMRAAQLVLDEARAGGAQPPRLSYAQRLVAEGADKPLLDVHFRDPDNGLAVGAYGLILATRNGGTTWESLQERIDNPKGKHLYGIHDSGGELYIAGEQGALYRRAAGGDSFAEVKTPYPGTFFGAISAASGELLVYGLRGNAFWTTDGGLHWQKSQTATPATLTAGRRLEDGSLILLDESGQLLRSVDGGRRFAQVPVSQPFPFTAVAQAADGSLVLAGQRGIRRIGHDAFSQEAKQ